MPQSVKAGLNRSQCSTRYASLDEATKIIRHLGVGILMVKFDLKETYKIVPVNPGDRLLPGMQWRRTLCINTVLPFWLRSAPKIFSVVADCLIWIMHLKGALPSLHYLDNFLLLGRPATDDCGRALWTMISLCEELGVPITP